MREKLRLLCLFVVILLSFSSISDAASRSLVGEGKAVGAGINMPLVGRLTGSGNTLFVTSLDVSNNVATAAEVDFYLTGTSGSSKIFATGSIDSSGALVAPGAATMRGRQNAHYDDFVDALVQAKLLSADVETNGFVGSVLFIFDGSSKSGQGTVTARFFNAFGGGTIGVAVKGHELTVNEPRSLTAVVRDSRGKTGPQLYANVFINNVGITPSGTAGDAVSVQVSAFSNSSGQPIGTPIVLSNIGPGETATVSNVVQSLGVTGSEDTISIHVTVISGNSLIEGLVSQVDNVTKDGSAFEMSRADF